MPRISKLNLTYEQRIEIMRKQMEKEPERIKRWEAERERQIAAERERNKWDQSQFPRVSDSSH